MSTEQKEQFSSILSASVFDQSAVIPPVVPSEVSVVSIADMPAGQANSIVITPAENNVKMQAAPVSSGVVASSNGMIAKYSEIFGTCTFNNCEIKFS